MKLILIFVVQYSFVKVNFNKRPLTRELIQIPSGHKRQRIKRLLQPFPLYRGKTITNVNASSAMCLDKHKILNNRIVVIYSGALARAVQHQSILSQYAYLPE